MTRLRVLVVAPWVPTAPARHAGGEAVLRHVEELSKRHDVTILAPAAPGVERAPADTRVLTVPWQPPRGVRGRAFGYLQWLVAGVGWRPAVVRSARRMLRQGSVPAITDGVDLVEAQYIESLPVASSVATAANVPMVLWSHDVVSHELRRQAVHARRARLRVEALLRLPGALRAERHLIPQCAGAVVFNPSDAGVLARRGLQGEVKVSRPPELEKPAATAVPRAARTVLLVAAFGRPVNAEGLEWLLVRVWPKVRREVPDAVLRLVGADAPETKVPGVVTVGFVERLTDEYARAAVAIAPLFAGVGLKFKVAQALSQGVPVIATPVAAEGLEPPPGIGFLAITAQPDAFAAAIVQALLHPDTAARVGAAGAAWWGQWCHQTVSEVEIARWYERLVEVT